MKRFNKIAALLTVVALLIFLCILLFWAFKHPYEKELPLPFSYFIAIVLSVWLTIGSVNLILYFKTVKEEIIKFINE